MNHILAFDQSSVKTGVSIFKQGKLNSWGAIDLHKCKEPDVKFQSMCKSISENIRTEKPDIVVFEDVSLQTNVATLRLLAQLQGVIIATCIDCGIPYAIYKPSTWRKILCFKQGRGISRKALKAQAIEYVKNHYNLDVCEDIADSICIGTAYVKENKNVN